MKEFKEYDFDDEVERVTEEVKYYKQLFRRCAEYLVLTEFLSYNEEADNFYHTTTGDYIDEGL